MNAPLSEELRKPSDSVLFTNRLGLPEPLVRAVSFIRSQYDKGEADFSVTELLQPPRIRILKKRHSDEIKEDIADQLYSFYGSVGHFILEQNAKVGIAEKRLFADYQGTTVSGSIDLQLDDTIYDYKFLSVTKVLYEDYEEFKKQLNIYADISRRNSKTPKQLKIVMIFRDWKKKHPGNENKYPFNHINYPNEPVKVLPLIMKKPEIVEEFVLRRIKLHKQAELELPMCTKDETWFRNGYSHRCENYCQVAKFCTQFQGSKNVKD